MDALGEGALLVTLGPGISWDINRRVHALAASLRALEISAIEDLIPAYSSLLVVFDDSKIAPSDVASAVSAALQSEAAITPAPGATHEIPVHYGGEDGPDLEALAASKGLSPARIVELHTRAPYQVYFLGFMPGFTYMGGLDPRLESPRLRTPRVRIPAGSVGIAGAQTGIYPLASPGGWQLIGRTSAPVWNVENEPPALFSPGDEVRFVATAEPAANDTHGPSGETETKETGALPLFSVEAAGGVTTIQDLGRPGYGHLGLSRGGAMEPMLAREANRLVGNAPGAAVLELTLGGPTLRALATTVIALAGSDFRCYVGSERIPRGVSWLVRAGSTVRFAGDTAQPEGARACLSVAGGFSVPLVLGSRSTYLAGSFGGYRGRGLVSGDTLWGMPTSRSVAELAGKYRPQPQFSPGTRTLRFVPFEGPGRVSGAVLQHACESLFTVSASSDRMGIRLEPEQPGALVHALGELTTFGVVPGAIQLPPAGTPIVLGADHQTTGGYPLLGVVARADRPFLAQLGPGDKARLTPVTLAEARFLARSVTLPGNE